MKTKLPGGVRPACFLIAFPMILFGLFSPVRGTAENPVTLKVSALPYLSYAPIFIADEEGFFAEQGLSLHIVKFSQSGQSIPALARGDLDVSADSIGSSLFSAVSRGMRLKIVADKGHLSDECSFGAIMVRKDLYDSGEITTIDRLKGRRVALELIPNFGYVYETILRKSNLTLDDIEIVEMAGPSKVAALKSGAIEAASAGDPLITQLEAAGIAVKLADYQDFVPGFHTSTIIFGPNLLEKNPELGRRFMTAYLKGVRQYNRGKTGRNLEILQKHTGLDLEILKKACFVSFYPDGHVNTDTIRAVQDWAYERNYIDRKIPVSQMVDMSFAEYANKSLGDAE